MVNATTVQSMIDASIGTAGAKYFKTGTADSFWLMVCGFLVFFMQCGFALLEAGTVRAKNTKNILLKNLLDACLGALIWWSLGYMIAVRAAAPREPTSPMVPRPVPRLRPQRIFCTP